MEQYQTARNQINDAVTQLGAGNNASATNSMLRALRKTKSASGQNMLEEISKHEPTIPYMLAGQATNPKSGGLGRYATDMGVAALAGYAVHPLAAAVPLLAGSPKIVGALNYGAGKVAGTASRVASKIPQKTAYYAGRANQEAEDSSSSESLPQSETGYNVGNIRDDEAGGFRSYETPEAAAAAVAHNLRSYPRRFNDGKPMTLREIANHWAPRKDKNDPDAWARNVALTAGVDPDQPIDQNDTSLMQRIIKGVHVAEHGQKNLYPDEVYARALNQAAASGGRIERASGGKVDNAKHERIVNKLMAMATKAKKVTDRTTESLLDEPDESIVKALNVAQQAI
jgi:hypothetical protein